MKLTVFLGLHGSESFDINLLDNQFVNKWIDELYWCLENCEFDHNENFVNFLSIEERKKVLLESIKEINNYLKNIVKKDFIELPLIIDWNNQDFYNYLHLQFEKLTNSFDSPTKLFQISPKNIKQSIRNLNFYIHNLEDNIVEKNTIGKIFKISFDKQQYRRKSLDIKDYENFTHVCEKNGLYLSYVELGKDLYEIWKENLPIDYEKLKNLHHYSGECYLFFGNTLTYEVEFYDFCKKNNIDYNDKTLGIGFIKLGTIENQDHIKNKLQNNKFLHSIKIERH